MHAPDPDFKQFKKLLIDLDLTQTAIADAIGTSSWAVTLYLRGKLKNGDTRNRIRSVMQRRAREKGIRLPSFWLDRK